MSEWNFYVKLGMKFSWARLCVSIWFVLDVIKRAKYNNFCFIFPLLHLLFILHVHCNFLVPDADVSFRKLTLERIYFLILTHRQMNLYLNFITSCVILDASWSLYYSINITTHKDARTHVRSAQYFVWIWSGTYREWPL